MDKVAKFQLNSQNLWEKVANEQWRRIGKKSQQVPLRNIFKNSKLKYLLNFIQEEPMCKNLETV